MSLVWRRLKLEWPAWLAVSFVVLLPVRRAAELPLSIFAVSLPFLLRNPVHRERCRELAPLMLALFACFWLPMVASSFDSYLPGKSWTQTLAAIRFPMAALSLAILLNTASLRWLVLRWISFVLLFWAADGFVQLLLGFDLFGIPMHQDRLNALFFSRYQFYGPVLAMLSPLLLEYARRRWPPWAWVVSFALVLGAVMIAGMRAGWLAMLMVVATYLLLMLRHENRGLRRVTMLVPATAVLVLALAYWISPLFQERVTTTLAITQNTEAGLDEASSKRLPIFRNAWRMYRAHPINGVGVRAFPAAYLEFADPDDPHVLRNEHRRGATHAHNIVLEVMADTGTIGLAGLIVAFVLVWRYWRSMPPDSRTESFPYALALVLVLFPLNTHFSIYGTYVSSLVWFLAGLWGAAARRDSLP